MRLLAYEYPSVVIDLGALEFVGIVDVHGFPFGEEIDGSDGGFAMTVAGLLRAAKRQMRFGADGRSIHINDARIEILDRGKRAVDVARID